MEIPFLRDVPFSTDDMELLGGGFSNRVYKSHDGWVLKAARYPESFVGLVREQLVLPRLSDLPIQTPSEYQVIEAGDVLPLGGACYRFIEGESCSHLTQLEQAHLARILLQLHDESPTEIPELQIAPWQWAEFAGCFDDKQLDRLQALFAAYPRQDALVRLVHGDIWPENLIRQNGDLVGVIDWEHSGAGDIAIDFAGMAYLSTSTLEGLLEAYVDAGGNIGKNFPERLLVCRFRRESSRRLSYRLRCSHESYELWASLKPNMSR